MKPISIFACNFMSAWFPIDIFLAGKAKSEFFLRKSNFSRHPKYCFGEYYLILTLIGSLFWKFSFGKRCKHTMIKLLSEYFCWGEDWILNGEKSRLQRKLLRCFQKIKYCLTLFLLQKTLPPKMCMYFCSSKYRNIFSSI